MKYTTHLVAFLDVLGFSEITLKSETSEDAHKTLELIFQKCDEVRTGFTRFPGKQRIKSMVMSDSIVLALELTEKTPSLEELANFFLAAGNLQYSLGKVGIWLRGGISIGSLYFDPDKKQVAGPALVKAVQLEQKTAKYPRIVVDPGVASASGIDTTSDFLNKVNSLYSADQQRALFEWRHYFDKLSEKRLPHDVPYFIDFARSKSDETALIMLAEKVATGLAGPIEYYEKYRWLADYILATNRQMNVGINENDQVLIRLLS